MDDLDIENDEGIQVPQYQTGAQLLGDAFGDDDDDMLAAAIAASMEQMQIDQNKGANDGEDVNKDEQAYLMQCMQQPEEPKDDPEPPVEEQKKEEDLI